MKVFGSSGTRGVAIEELSPSFVLRVAQAAGTVWAAERVGVARDTRVTGTMFADAAASGLASVGCDVDRLGVIATPGAQAYAAREGVPVVMITASHNPPQYNGVKLVGPSGVELPVATLERVEERLLADDFGLTSWDTVGRVRYVEDATDRYVEELLSVVDRDAIAAADLTVALDPGHGAGALTSPEFFRRLGCRVVTVNAQPDGRFPGRNPEPVAANLTDLGRLVRAADADVGIAHDGDGDRAIFFDETGAYIEGDATLAALAADALGPGDSTVAAVNVSQRLVDVVDRADATLELTPIGSTNLITRIKELHAQDRSVPIAGEGNGGIFFPGYRIARDGAYTAAKFLELLVDRPASTVVSPYTAYANVRVNLTYDTDAEREAMLQAAESFAHDADADLSTIDGYRMDYGDAWVLVRPSGTEPLVRIYAEAKDGDRATDLAESCQDALEVAKTAARD